MEQNIKLTEQDFTDLCKMMEDTMDAATGIGYIMYMWSPELDIGKGAMSDGITADDAITAIVRIAKAMNINPDALKLRLELEYKNDEDDDNGTK